MVRQRLWRGAAAALLAVAVALPALAAGTPVEATSWIDAPLQGAVVPVAPVEVVAHSADQATVREVVLEVAGEVVGQLPVDPPERLVTTRFRWIPPGAGTYLLLVRARNAADEWGAPAAVTVLVAEDAPPIPTVGPGGTAAPGESGSPAPGASTPPSGAASAPPGASPSGAASRPPGSSPGATAPPGSSPTPAPSKTPKPPTPVPTTQPTLCPLPGPTLLAPDDNIIYAAADNPQPVFEWDWNGSPACIDHFVLVLNLDQQVEEYADSGGYQREYPVAPDTTVYQSPIVLLPDDSDLADGCGYYSWTVMAIDADGNGEQAAQVWSIKVCPGRTG